MRNERDARTFLLRRVSGSAWLTIAILAACGLFATWWLVDGEGVSTVATVSDSASGASTTGTASDDASPEVQSTGQSQVVGSPTPEAVLVDPQCRMLVGQRTASDTALVYVPLGEGAWFAVVNTFGVVFDGTLPFVPERPAVGKRPDGTILAGFGFEGEVRVVHDGSVIYEFDDVLSFDIADDGSSFFVVEPLAGDASRLVVRNLDLREEHHFDLGTPMSRTDRGLDFRLSYSADLGEVIVQPAHGQGGTSRFYPVAGGNLREISVEHRLGMLPKDHSILVTSELSYHAHNQGDTAFDRTNFQWKIVKVERDYGTGVERVGEVWARDLEFTGFLSMQLSANGAWLVLSDLVSGVEVLDTTDGETVFTYPGRRDIRMTLLRYSRRLQDEEERFSGRFVGNRLVVFRSLEDKPDDGSVEVYEMDKTAKRARRVRKLKVERGVDEAEQTFAIRTSLDPDAPMSCIDHALLDTRLVVSDGRLIYGAADY